MPHFGSSKFERLLSFETYEENLKSKKFCCERMQLAATYECKDCHDKWQCGDQLIHYDLVFDEYGLIIHDGGASYILIEYCPWCGDKLPVSKRDRWFDELEDLGFNDPVDKDIPEKYKSNAWYE